MPDFPALAQFMEARSTIVERASLRPHPSTGEELCLDLSALLDAAIEELAAGADHAADSAFAVVAVGGYGRSELARLSDVDVMLLVEGKSDHALRMLYPLWDASLKVGHSVRTVPQIAESARENLETLTSLLDARFLAGERRLYDAFVRERLRLLRGNLNRIRADLTARREEVRLKTPWQTLTVDLKVGRGGLRDLHAMHWVEKAAAILEDRAETPLSSELAEAREVLLRTRHAVHALNDRPTDVFRPEYAEALCQWLGEEPFAWSWRLYAAMRTVEAAASTVFRPAPPPKSRWPWRSRSEPAVEVPPPADDLDALRQALSRAAPGGPLDPLPRQPWLDRLLPEWELLRARPHVAPFHVHPVDTHAVRTVHEVRELIAVDEFGADVPRVAREFGDTDEILVAALLHDVGKGHAGVKHPEVGAVIVERFAARAGLSGEASARLVAAVRHHLLLPAVATRRDIADPEVIAETAATVGDSQQLRLLYVLSVADARASSPNVWSQWKAQLMRSLYERVLAVLDVAPQPDGMREEAIVRALASRFPEATVREHLSSLETGYLLSMTPGAIGDHIALIAQANGASAVRRDRLGEIDRVTVVAPDRPGLMQDIAGTLAGFSVNVLGGIAYTRSDGVAIEVWHVSDALGVGIDDRRWERVLAALPAAALGEFDVAERLEQVRRSYPQPPRREDIPTTVNVENSASRDYSILEISAPDRRGLLYAVTSALHEMRIDIHLAKVDTIGPEVFDAFYIRRQNGSRIEEPDAIERLEKRVAAVLHELG